MIKVEIPVFGASTLTACHHRSVALVMVMHAGVLVGAWGPDAVRSDTRPESTASNRVQRRQSMVTMWTVGIVFEAMSGMPAAIVIAAVGRSAAAAVFFATPVVAPKTR
jgi:hypothetical protein